MTLKGTIPNLIPALLKLDLTSEFDLEIKPHKDKRSLTANGYYWKLLEQYAVWGHRSMAYTHNDVLSHYSVVEDGVEAWLPDTEQAEFRAMESQRYHLLPTNACEERDGILKRRWLVMRGSHDMNTAEFSRIVDGLILMIQGDGADIETMTPAELETLKGYHGKA